MRVPVLRMLALVAMLLLLMNVIYWRANPVSYAYNPNNLIRLHVIASSDNEADQAIKDAVAARVRAEMVTMLGDEPGRVDPRERSERTWELLHRELALLEVAVAGVLEAWGAPYGGQVELGVFPFPARSYGDTPVPAGMYRAVRVTLGEGSGSNWWCILFPPLCLVDPAAGPSVRQPDPAALELILSDGDLDDAELEVRWVVLELLRGLNQLAASMRTGLIGLIRPAPTHP